MAIKLPDGRIMRTLPEQVDKNMQDIATINNEVNVIKESISIAYKIQGSATVADLNANRPDAAMNGYVYNMTDAGSLINSDESTTSVQIGDNVVLVWNDGNYFWDRLSGVVDTSNLVTLDTDQTITGLKTFDNQINFYNSVANVVSAIQGTNYGGIDFKIGNSSIFLIEGGAIYSRTSLRTTNSNADLGTSTFKWRDLYLSNGIHLGNGFFKYDSGFRFDAGILPDIGSSGPNGQDIGGSAAKWRSLYLAGEISDGTNSVTVAQISKTKLYKHQMTVSNVTGPVNVILTNNTPITGSFGANMSSQIVIAAYLTAQSNASQMKTPNGGLAQINSDGTISITVSVGETITNDTVTEL